MVIGSRQSQSGTVEEEKRKLGYQFKEKFGSFDIFIKHRGGTKDC